MVFSDFSLLGLNTLYNLVLRGESALLQVITDLWWTMGLNSHGEDEGSHNDGSSEELHFDVLWTE